ncbi:unnamed protein product [Allacma fusca]|uniref:Glucose-methanol-choline oxidoreductase N-terminal domain-containing protein n=1 Tax=Allacma fusca TaxID=39272 RepID=A0A8J2PB71_9HEXA|nr:unnamed protein product [Allacma fusca]
MRENPFISEYVLFNLSRAFLVLNASLPLLVNLYESQYREDDRLKAFPRSPKDFNLPVKETFDFIIVGAGTAGCILARRLSANYKVLLLEAGGDPPPLENVPTLGQLIKYTPAIHWIYGSTKQQNAALDSNGIIVATAGKMMGGSGSHNHCHYERGHPLDFDHWANITGDSSWNFKNILKYYLRSENYKGSHTNYGKVGGRTEVVHHKGGLMNVVASNFTFRDDLWFSAGKELGYKVKLDSNGPQQEGFSSAEYNRRKGRRMSTYVAFVEPIENRWMNLTVRRYSVVSEVIFEGKRAIGVQYEHHGVPKIVFVSKEVILSAGSYISPIILIRSGVGPKKQVTSINKPLVADLPVGENLQDHVVVPMPPIVVRDKSVFKYALNNLSFDEFDNFINNGGGFLSALDAFQEAFIASNRATFLDNIPNWPDIQLYFGQGYHKNEDVLTCNVHVNRPYSRGKISVNTTSSSLESNLLPLVDYNYFSDETDYDVAIEGVEVCRRVVEQTAAFRNIGARFDWDSLPVDCGSPRKVGYRDYWKCYIRHRSTSNYHVTSTNSMGKADDPHAVVDSELKVRGISGLRVVDASVMPTVTNANINAPVMMIAEKAAANIARTWAPIFQGVYYISNDPFRHLNINTTLFFGNAQLIHACTIVMTVSATHANVFVIWFIALFGICLVEIHTNVYTRLVTLWELTEKPLSLNMIESHMNIVMPERVVPAIKNLKIVCKLYNDVGGVYVLCTVVRNILTYMEIGHNWVSKSERPIFWQIEISVTLISMFILTYFGHYLRKKVKGNRENLVNAYGYFIQSQETGTASAHLERITKWLLEWKWRFTARNLFDVDYNIFGVVCGSVLTYFIVMYQMMMGPKERISSK